MFAALGLAVCDDAAAIAEARDAQRDAKNRQLNSTKGSVAVAAQAWFESVDRLLNKRTELLEDLYGEFSALADALMVMAGSAGRKRLARKVRTELAALAERWLGAREDLATAWVDRWLAERGRALPSARAGDEESTGSKRRSLLLATAGAIAVSAALGGLYHGVGLGTVPENVAAAATADEDASDETLTEAAAEPATAQADPTPTLDGPAESAPQESTTDALVIDAAHAPTVAFAGHRLVIAVQTQEDVTSLLMDELFEGATLYDVRLAPGGLAVELSVDKPTDEDAEGLARWSFRVSDHRGRISEPIVGNCRVLPGGW
jgi:hypothetical protein